MNLYLATYLLAGIYLAFGLGFFFKSFTPFALAFLRDKTLTLFLGAVAIAWFVYCLYNLGEADFGQYKFFLIAIFGGAGVLAFYYLPDFLGVRALCVILLLSMRVFLDAAFMQEPAARLLMVSYAYITIVAAIYFGCLPYRARDAIEYLSEKPLRAKIYASFMTLSGIALLLSTLFF